MQFEGALVKEQGVTFGILIVKPHVLNVPADRDQMVGFGRSVWGAVPIVLMKQDGRTVPTYWGRPDIVRFLANIHPGRIPWKRYTVSGV
jgi:hypothetical protein